MQPPTSHHSHRTAWQLLGIWLFLRVFTSVWAALVSPLRPLTAREQTIALWPPSAPLGAWLERAFLAPWERWDVKYYLWIVARGYRAEDGTAAFHPLFPWLATPLAWLSGQPLLGLLLVGSLASVLMLLAFERLAQLDQEPATARISTVLFIFSPMAFVFFAPYTEGLFLVWAVLCFLWARRRSWWLAGLAGALATLTRQQGLFLVIPLAWELVEAAGRDGRRALAAWRDWLSIGLIPLAMAAWLIYRTLALGDWVNLGSFQSLISSLLISPSTAKVVSVYSFMWPWQALWLAVSKLVISPDSDLIINLILGGGLLVLTAIAWGNMRTSYRLYTLAIILISFSDHTGPVHPYMGLPRHLLLAFPVFIGLGPVLRRPWMRLAAVAGGLAGMSFLLLQYVIEAWVP